MRMRASPSVGWPCLCWQALCWQALCWLASLAGLLAGGRVTRPRWGGAWPGYPPVERGRWRGLSTVYGVAWLQRSGGGGKRDREGDGAGIARVRKELRRAVRARVDETAGEQREG